MRNHFPQFAALVLTAAAWSLTALLVWTLHRQWWRIRAVKRALVFMPLGALALIVLWGVASRSGDATFVATAGTIGSFAFALSIGIAISLPFSGIALTAERVVNWFARRGAGASAPEVALATAGAPIADAPVIRSNERVDRGDVVMHSRRSFVTKAAAAFPATFMGAATVGIGDSYRSVRMPTIPLSFDTLDPRLHGLRILQLSDIHLGHYVDLEDLERTLREVEKLKFDMVLVTGDSADDLDQLPEGLRMIAALKPRYGVYASLGNHEYYRDLNKALRIFDASPVPLLRETGVTLDINGARLYVGGADDPARERDSGKDGKIRFLHGSVERAMSDAPSDAFGLLMSHRPEGFIPASAMKIPLTLSGHTHGGAQMGLGGRSILQPFFPQNYFWGHYQREGSQLYTTSGVGHWFPFRLGCPREAPVYELLTPPAR